MNKKNNINLNVKENKKINQLGDVLDVGYAKYSLTFIIPLFIFFLSMSISFITGTIYFADSENLATKEKLLQLESQGKVVEKLLSNIYNSGENDIGFLSGTPPVQSIIEAIKNNNEESEQVWRSRLNVIFEQFLKNEKDFIEARFIQLNKNNKELVSSYKINNSVYSTPIIQLKHSEPLNINSMKFERSGQVFFRHLKESVERNMSSHTIMQIVTPIFSESSGLLFGIVELKVDLGSFIESLGLENLIHRSLYVAEENGRLLFELHTDDESGDLVRESKLIQNVFPQLREAIDENEPTHSFIGEKGRVSGHYRLMHLQKSDSKNITRLFIELDYEQYKLTLESYRDRSLLIGGGLAVAFLILSIFVSRKITQPIQEIAHELIRYEYSGEIKKLPLNAQSEVGVLARSFNNMLINQQEKDTALYQQKFALDAHSIVSTTDVRGNITYVNEKFCDISGYSKEELIGQNHRLLNSKFHDASFFKEMYRSLINGETWHGDICNQNKRNEIYWVQTTIVPFMNRAGKPESYISIRTDITKSKMDALEISETRDVLAFQVSQLKEANADLDQFAYVASHDLKSPLNGISQLVSWIEEDCEDTLPEESKEHLGLLKSRSKRMLNLLNDLLEYSRIGRDQHAIELLNLKATVDELFGLQGGTEGFICTGQDVDFRLQRIPFEMVLRNLISNATKHHDKKEGNIDVSYELVEVDDVQKHQFTVTDDGPGIPPELQDKAMEMFQTLQSRDETEGSGMGLAMVKKMVEKYDGSLQIQSDGKNGSTFIVLWGV